MSDIKRHIRAGFTDTFTRMFSILTIIFGLLLFFKVMDPVFEGSENFDLFLLLLGLHGVITNPYDAGSVRKLLCNISLLAAFILIIYSVVLLFKKFGMIGTMS
ncbi:MAG: hypothetical protein Q7U10_01950 [Thermodesulfovibrionia bacterium]|nr:hypothetical protein [Thermodesulfovibrionia bacterium]